MKRYKVLSGFCIRVGEDVYPGTVVTFAKDEVVLEAEAIRLGRVQEITGAAGAAPSGDESEGDGEGDPPDGETATERRRRR